MFAPLLNAAPTAQMVRFADDAVLCFQRKEDAQRVLAVLGKRMAKYGLKLHPEKTKLVDFRPPQWGQSKGRGSFDFLGFCFHWARSRKGRAVVKLKRPETASHARLKNWASGYEAIGTSRLSNSMPN